jgi:glycosyltransferase involved in cell wall biosynthesis
MLLTRNRVAPTVSVVIPAKNEAANLREVLPRLPMVHEVILVDGNSVDDTIAAAREVMPDIRVVEQTRRGKGNALACGFLAASGDIIVMFDADGSADPAEIPAFVQALVDGADFAKGSRFALGGGSEDITPLRSLGNHGLNFVANRAFKTTFTDLCYGYNAFWRDLVPVLDLPDIDTPAPADAMLWGDGFEIETVINCRFAAAQVTITEVPSIELSRIHGVSNLRTFSDGTRVLRTIAAEHRRKRQGRDTVEITELTHAREELHPRTDLIETPDSTLTAQDEFSLHLLDFDPTPSTNLIA